MPRVRPQAQEDLSIQELADSGLQLPGRPPSSSRDHLYARVKDVGGMDELCHVRIDGVMNSVQRLLVAMPCVSSSDGLHPIASERY